MSFGLQQYYNAPIQPSNLAPQFHAKIVSKEIDKGYKTADRQEALDFEEERMVRKERFGEDTTEKVIKNARGYLICQKDYRDRVPFYSEPLLRIRNPRMSLYYRNNPEDPNEAIIDWDGGKIKLSKNEISPKGVGNALKCSGHPICVGKNSATKYYDLIFEFLFTNAAYERLLDNVGWQRIDGDLVYIPPTEDRMKEFDGKLFSGFEIILKSYVVNKGLLKEWGISLSKPIGIVANRVQRMRLNCLFEDTIPGVIDESLTRSGLENSLCDPHKLITFFYYEGTERSKRILKDLVAAMVSDVFNGKPLNVVPIVFLSEESITGNISKDLLIFRMDDGENGLGFAGTIVPSVDNLDLIKDYILKSVRSNDLDEDEIPFVAAACCLFPHANESLIEEFFEIIHQKYEISVATRSGSEVDSVVAKAVYEWCLNNEIDLIAVDKTIQVDDVKQIIIFDEEYIYVPEELFGDIIRTFREEWPINFIKSVIKAKGLIRADYDRYTTKVSIINKAGKRLRPRRVAFSRKMLGSLCLGEMDIVDLIRTKGGQMNEKNGTTAGEIS